MISLLLRNGHATKQVCVHFLITVLHRYSHICTYVYHIQLVLVVLDEAVEVHNEVVEDWKDTLA